MKRRAIMFEQDLPKFAALIVGMGELYGKSFTSAVIDIYWQLLKPFNLGDVKQAIYCHMENPDSGKYLPKPADIIMAIGGSSQTQALLAWSKVVSAIQKVGIYTSVAFDDALIHRVIVDMGGWLRLCGTKSAELPFVAKEFQDRYRGYVTKKPTSYPNHLVGLIEQQNDICGSIYEPPALIGDPVKARQVVSAGSNELFLENFRINRQL